MQIRNGTDADGEMLCRLQIASIQHFCKNFYSSAAIEGWIKSKSAASYQNLGETRCLIVAEEKLEIVGFGLLSLHNAHIDNLYVAPNHAGKGYGKILLQKLEAIAQAQQIQELHLMATLNARNFYHHFDYVGDVEGVHVLSSGVELACVRMWKQLKISHTTI